MVVELYDIDCLLLYRQTRNEYLGRPDNQQRVVDKSSPRMLP